MDQEPIIYLSEKEKTDLFPSLYFINANLHVFVENLFQNFLQTDAGELLKNTDLELLKKRFESSFKIILYNIQYPMNLQDHLDLLIMKHAEYRLLPEYFDNFIESFNEAIIITLPQTFEQNSATWAKLITQIVDYFKKKMF